MQEQKKDTICTKSILFGNKNAKVKIRIFNDIYCGYCKLASEKYRQIFSKDTSVNIEFIFYPLFLTESNKQVIHKTNTFPYRILFAASSDMEFWNFHDLIIRKSGILDSLEVFEIAEKSLENFNEFKDKFSNISYNYYISENISLADEYKVQGTPTVYINGRELQQWTNLNLLRMIVKQSTNTIP